MLYQCASELVGHIAGVMLDGMPCFVGCDTDRGNGCAAESRIGKPQDIAARVIVVSQCARDFFDADTEQAVLVEDAAGRAFAGVAGAAVNPVIAGKGAFNHELGVKAQQQRGYDQVQVAQVESIPYRACIGAVLQQANDHLTSLPSMFRGGNCANSRGMTSAARLRSGFRAVPGYPCRRQLGSRPCRRCRWCPARARRSVMMRAYPAA
jgi:hypothetical protein